MRNRPLILKINGPNSKNKTLNVVHLKCVHRFKTRSLISRKKNPALTAILNVFLILNGEIVSRLYYFHAHGLCHHRYNNNSPSL